MEKINVAELLKNCPQGMELYSPIYGVGVLTKVTDRIHVKFPKEHNVKCFRLDGKVSEDGEIMLYPKGGNTWEGFVPPLNLKNGDVIYVKDAYGREWCSIIDNCKHGALYTYVDICIESNKLYRGEAGVLCDCKDVKEYRRATEKEKQKLFDAIKANGYKWDSETKTLEKLIQFKVGDRIIYKSMYLASKYGVLSINRITEDEYVVVIENTQQKTTISIQDQNEFMIAPEVRLVFEKKFDITTLIPFESKVLVRDGESQYWRVSFWGCLIECGFMYDTVRGIYKQCIPYEGNEHLLGKTDDCDEFYKTWE